MRVRCMGTGTSLGKEAVLAASGRAGEVAAGLGRERRATFQHPAIDLSNIPRQVACYTEPDHTYLGITGRIGTLE